MTLPTATAHTDAVKTLLTASLPADITMFDGNVPKTSLQMYAVLYPDPGNRDRSALPATSDAFAMTVQVTCVGLSARQARVVIDAVCTALVDQRPVVAGRTCWPITQQEGTPPVVRDDDDRDPTTGQPRFYYTPRFRVASTV